MPYTPYHFGPNGLAGMFLMRVMNLPALILINVIIDLESLTVIMFHIRTYPEHGFFHSFTGATVLALLFSLAYSCIKRPVNRFMTAIKLGQSNSLASIVAGRVFRAWIHVFLDSCLYRDIMPFFPSDYNPMYGKISPPDMRMFCVISAGVALVVYFLRIILKKPGNRI